MNQSRKLISATVVATLVALGATGCPKSKTDDPTQGQITKVVKHADGRVSLHLRYPDGSLTVYGPLHELPTGCEVGTYYPQCVKVTGW